jgi:hypothetical protein
MTPAPSPSLLTRCTQALNRPFFATRDLCKSKIIEYCLATKEDSARYLDPALIEERGAVVAPPSFAGVIAKKAWSGFYRELGLDPNYVLMTRFHARYARPLEAYTDYTTEVRISAVRQKGRHVFFDVHHEIADPGGSVVATLDVGLGYPSEEVPNAAQDR